MMPKLLSQRAKRLGRLMLFLGWVLPPSTFAAIALLSPLDVLDRLPELGRGCNWVHAHLTGLLPDVDVFRHARSTAFPQVATLSTAFALLALPWIFVLTVSLTALTNSVVRVAASRMSVKHLLSLSIALLPFAILCLFAFFAMPGDPSFAGSFTSGSRCGYALVGSATVAFGGIGVSLWPIALFTLVFDVFLGRHIHG